MIEEKDRLKSKDILLTEYKLNDGTIKYAAMIDADKISSAVLYFIRASNDWEIGEEHFKTIYPKLYEVFKKQNNAESFYIWFFRRIFKAVFYE